MDDPSTALLNKIYALKKSRNAIFLAHNYQLGEIQDIADFVGDSLELSQKAARTDADVILFCGVHFMAETASVLCPDKTVLLPNRHAGCPMASMITPAQLRKKKKEHPGAIVVCYVNTTAAVKAESDICCTSANAVKIVESLPPDKEIIFVPDQYLGSHVAAQTGRKMILWPGFCNTHVRILPEDITRLRSEYPEAKVLAHPECRPEVTALADAVMSTGGIIRYSRESETRELIIATEIGILHRLRKENPGKRFIPVTEQAVCPRMKLITLDTVLWSLEKMSYQIKVPDKIRLKAKAAVDRMLEI
ncbi:MAG: quinolinate synthase NadA [Dehalococcoidales bacterium]